MVGKARKAWHQLQRKGDDTAVFPKRRLRTANLGPCPQVYALHLFLITSMTLEPHLYPVRLSPSYVFQLRTAALKRDVTPRQAMHRLHHPGVDGEHLVRSCQYNIPQTQTQPQHLPLQIPSGDESFPRLKHTERNR